MNIIHKKHFSTKQYKKTCQMQHQYLRLENAVFLKS